MATITIGGKEIHTSGSLPPVGEKAPGFTLTNADLEDVTLGDFIGKKVILNIFPSIGTGVCQTAVRTFNSKMNQLPNTVVLCISRDLPFATKEFCGAEGLTHVITLSEFRKRNFSRDYGVTILDGKFEGLLARAVVIIDEQGLITYTEQVPEIGQEPDYEAALSFITI